MTNPTLAARRRAAAQSGTTVVTATQAQFHSGPLPSATELARYDEVLPGLADRIVRLAENQSQHRQGIEAQAVAANIDSQKRGARFGLILGLGGLILAGALVYKGETGWGVATVLGETLGYAAVFVTGRWIQFKERKDRRQPPAQT